MSRLYGAMRPGVGAQSAFAATRRLGMLQPGAMSQAPSAHVGPTQVRAGTPHA